MFENLQSGFQFLTFAAGVGLIFMLIVTVAAADDRSDKLGIWLIIDIVLAIMVLIFGFMWHAL